MELALGSPARGIHHRRVRQADVLRKEEKARWARPPAEAAVFGLVRPWSSSMAVAAGVVALPSAVGDRERGVGDLCGRGKVDSTAA